MRVRLLRELVCAGLIGLWSGPLLAGSQGEPVNPDRYGIQRNGYTSSLLCKRCHGNVYDVWARSMHANATHDPVFLAAYEVAVERGGKAAKRLCLSCHSPTTRQTSDYDLIQPLSNEGITCDFCHTVAEVDPSRPDPFTHELGTTKRGVHEKMSSPAHFTKYSSLHSQSKFCGGCHDFRNPEGVPILETYTEWKNGDYAARGVQCQDCHMRRQPGKPLVNPEIKIVNELAPDHAVTGGHTIVRLQDAAKVSVTARDRGKNVEVVARVANVGAGHKIPTGAPTRRMVLEVSLMSPTGKSLETQRRVYQKTLVDERGQTLTSLEDSFTRAKRVESDNRLAPKEERVETFTFKMPRARDKVIVEALLTYRFETPPGTMYVKMSEATCLLLLTSLWGAAGIGLVSRNALIIGLAAGVLCWLWILNLRRNSPGTIKE